MQPSGETHTDVAARASFRVLVAEDEPIVRRTVCDSLVDRGFVVAEAVDGEQALALLDAEAFDSVITDLKMPGASGLEVLKRARSVNPACAVIVMTAYGTIQTAIQAVRQGAFQYLTKPFELADLVLQVDRALAQRKLVTELENARMTIAQYADGPIVIARSAKMRRTLALAQAVGATEASVLVLGETGAGKEVVARTIHHASARRAQPLIALNCSAIPESLFEAELFGVERGAFTGANLPRDGRFLAAHRGTLFLDEIGDLPLSMQAKLLRVLEEGTVCRLGSSVPIPVNVRIVAATHRDLKSMVAARGFRDDLYFRLNVVSVQVPPLRERPEDLPGLASHFVEATSAIMTRSPPRVAIETLEALTAYSWPGNVRELKNVVHRALVVCGTSDIIEPHHLPDDVFDQQDLEFPTPPGVEAARLQGTAGSGVRPLVDVMAEVEKRTLRQAVEATGGNRSEAARLLRISRKQLWQKLKQYGM
ncbi:MAG: sigma-54-dependent Fis family transcriptional regulator [Deltaproteobacteria bacterium]|nr:sigma-54-dependent Fis family transcriptional regulator [Deltaproteobacteria bacterium]